MLDASPCSGDGKGKDVGGRSVDLNVEVKEVEEEV